MKIGFEDTAKVVITHPVTDVDLVHPDGTKVSITVYGSQSRQYKNAKTKALNNRMLKKNKLMTAEQVEANAAEMLASCTESFNNFDGCEFDGYDGEYTAENAKEIYLGVSWLKDQVDIAIADNAVFSTPS